MDKNNGNGNGKEVDPASLNVDLTKSDIEDITGKRISDAVAKETIGRMHTKTEVAKRSKVFVKDAFVINCDNFVRKVKEAYARDPHKNNKRFFVVKGTEMIMAVITGPEAMIRDAKTIKLLDHKGKEI